MRLGTMTSLFREKRGTDAHIGYLESIRRCRAAGFEVLDMNLCALPRYKTDLHGPGWRDRVSDIRNEAEKLGLIFSQSHPPYRPPQPLEGEALDFFKAMSLRAIEISEMLGVKWAVLHPVGGGDQEEDLEASIRLNHEMFAEEIDLAMRLGVGIAFENMADGGRRRFGATASSLKVLVDSYADSRVGACWDTGHAHRQYEDQTAQIQKLGSRIKALHIDDNYSQTDAHLMPFLGTVPWEAVMSSLREAGYAGDCIYEIRINDQMPDALKDVSARFAFEVGRYLVSLFDRPPEHAGA